MLINLKTVLKIKISHYLATHKIFFFIKNSLIIFVFTGLLFSSIQSSFIFLKKYNLLADIELSLDNKFDKEDDNKTEKEEIENDKLFSSFHPNFNLTLNDLIFDWSPFQPKTLNTIINIQTPPPEILS